MLVVPFGITCMDIEYEIELVCESKGVLFRECESKRKYFVMQDIKHSKKNRITVKCPDVDVVQLLNEKWIAVRMKVDIKNIYDVNGECIGHDKWDKFGFFS